MMVNPVPKVTLSATGHPDLVFTPATPSGPGYYGQQLYALDDLQVKWGRQDILAHPEPSTASFSILQQGNGLVTDWRGAQVVASWTDPASGFVRIFFRGRITDQKLRPRQQAGVFVDITAVGRDAELANVLTATETWPEESLDARMNRLKALVGTRLAGIDYRSYWSTGPVSARKVDGSPVLDLLRSMYDSMGADRMIYNPENNRIGYMMRKAVAADSQGWAPRAYLRTDPNTAATINADGSPDGRIWPGGGVYLSARTGTAGPMLWPMLDAHWIEGGDLEADLQSQVTRAVLHWTETNGTVAATAVRLGSDESSGVIATDIATEWRQSDWAQLTGASWLGALLEEGRNFVPEEMTYRADQAGGFDTLWAARLLLSGRELSDSSESMGGGAMVAIAGSTWARFGITPIVSVIGGTVRYVRGSWRPTIHTQIPWWEGTHWERISLTNLRANPARNTFRLRDMAPGIKWNDLYQVSSW